MNKSINPVDISVKSRWYEVDLLIFIVKKVKAGRRVENTSKCINLWLNGISRFLHIYVRKIY